MNNKDIKDKAVFVLGFLAIFIALSPFKQELSKININIGGSEDFNLLGALVVFTALLIISVYLYALDYTKYNFPKYQNSIIFRWIIPLANLFYSLAIWFPLMIILMMIINIGPIKTFINYAKVPIIWIDLFLIFILLIIGIYKALKNKDNGDEEKSNLLEESRIKSLYKSLALIKKDFYGEALIEVYKAIEQYIKERLLSEKRYTTKYMPMRELLDLAYKNKLIDTKDMIMIKDLQGLRNKAVHSFKIISKENAEFGIEVAKKVFEGNKVKNDK